MLYESDGDLIRLTLNRPQALNAVDDRGTLELHQTAQAIHDDPTARAVIIRGAGRAFCAGIDLKELAAGETPQAYFYHWDRALRLLELSDKLVLCAIQGYALGGGLQLPLACDIRIATPDAQLGLPAAKEGFIPAWALTVCRVTSASAGPRDWRFRARMWTATRRCASGWWTTS